MKAMGLHILSKRRLAVGALLCSVLLGFIPFQTKGSGTSERASEIPKLFAENNQSDECEYLKAECSVIKQGFFGEHW